MELNTILTTSVEKDASDILIVAGMPVAYKINGVIERIGADCSIDDTEKITTEIYKLARDRDMTRLIETGDDDFSFAVRGLCRFRVNALRQRGSFGLIIRIVSFNLPDKDKLGVPDTVMNFAKRSRGLLLVTGPAGSGKSTTLACIIDHINSNLNKHVITIEDPIEYLHHHKKSVVTQREISTDTASYDTALRAALREAPDIILLGEMRDPETIKAAVTAAETGHLVISTLHTLGVSNTVDRIIDTFPPEQQQQIRTQLAMVVEGIVSQQLMRATDGSLIPAFEVMNSNSAIRNIIRESRAHQLDNIISQSAEEGMCLMDQYILKLVNSGKISKEEATRKCVNAEWMAKRLAAR